MYFKWLTSVNDFLNFFCLVVRCFFFSARPTCSFSYFFESLTSESVNFLTSCWVSYRRTHMTYFKGGQLLVVFLLQVGNLGYVPSILLLLLRELLVQCLLHDVSGLIQFAVKTGYSRSSPS